MAWYLTPNGVGSGLILLPQGVCALPGQTHTNQTHNTDAQNYSFSGKDHGHEAQTTYLSMPGLSLPRRKPPWEVKPYIRRLLAENEFISRRISQGK